MKDFTQVISFPSPQSAAEVGLWLKLKHYYTFIMCSAKKTFKLRRR